jgi:hypothetical protein
VGEFCGIFIKLTAIESWHYICNLSKPLLLLPPLPPKGRGYFMICFSEGFLLFCSMPSFSVWRAESNLLG